MFTSIPAPVAASMNNLLAGIKDENGQDRHWMTWSNNHLCMVMVTSENLVVRATLLQQLKSLTPVLTLERSVVHDFILKVNRICCNAKEKLTPH